MNTITRVDINTAGVIPAEHPDAALPTPKMMDQEIPVEMVIPVSLRQQTAPQLLRKAVEVMEARALEYDKPGGERSVAAVVTALNAVLGRTALIEAEGWLFMELLKNVRLFSAPGYHADSALDGIAYSALKAEAMQLRMT